MLAHVEKKNNHVRKDERRLSPSEAERLKVPLPVIGHTREHKRQHKQQAPRSSKDNKATKGIGRDVVTDGVNDNITDDVDAARGPSQRHNPGWQNQTQVFEENDVDEFEDIDDAFVYQAMGDQQVEAMKQRLAGNIGYKSTDKYIEGDSYPDTTSGRLTEPDAQNPQEDDYSMQAVQNTVMMSIPRTRSAGDYPLRQAQGNPQQNGFVHDSSIVQPLFRRPDNVAHDDAPSFQMSAIRRGQSATQPVVPQPQSAAKKQHRPINQVNLYQQTQPPRIIAAESQARAAVARGVILKTQHPPIHNDRPVDSTNVIDDYSSEPIRTRADQAHLPASDEEVKISRPTLLDHDLQALHMMEYKQLREEPFDHDPQAEPSTVPLNGSEDPLSSKLDALAALSPDEWFYFFHSLDLEKWEDAGDWFIEQYASILSKLKDVRRQRRSAAQAFELEVEQRQQAVVNKRIAIRNTMESMRTHGAQVLLTPNKITG